jgi:hypothetical protein
VRSTRPSVCIASSNALDRTSMSSGPKPGLRRSMSGVRRRPRRPQPADPRLRSRSARQLARSLLAPPQSSRVRRWSPTRSALAIAASAGFTGAILARNPSSLGNQDHATGTTQLFCSNQAARNRAERLPSARQPSCEPSDYKSVADG